MGNKKSGTGMRKFFEPTIGIITGGITWELINNFALAITVAFASGVSAYLAREFCDYLKMKLKKRKSKNA